MFDSSPALGLVTLAALADRPQWVAWRNDMRKAKGGQEKLTKVPYSPHTGRPAMANRPATWGTRAQAEAAMLRLTVPGNSRALGGGGLGLEFGAITGTIGIGGIDLDTCRSGDGTFEPWAAGLISEFDTYTEISPSGTGAKMFFTYELTDVARIRSVMGKHQGQGTGRKWTFGKCEHAPGIELYLDGRFFAVTEDKLPEAPGELRPVSAEMLLELIERTAPDLAEESAEASEPKERSRRSSKPRDTSRSGVAFRKGVALKRAGKTFEEMCEALRADPETEEWCREKGDPDDQRELRNLWDNANSAPLIAGAPTEHNFATYFVRMIGGRLCYCHDTGSWYRWNGQAWCRDSTQFALDWCRAACAELGRSISDAKIRATLGRQSTITAVERLTRADQNLSVTAKTWDNNKYLLGTPTGTYDLRTGDRKTTDKADYITKQTSVAPAERPDCPLWLGFLNEATRGDSELIRFLQQWCGYSLTGDTREHALLFIFGPGGNGKSVFLNTIRSVMCDYAVVAPMETFTASKSERHPTEVAMLRGARLVCVSETEEGRTFAETRVKSMTGGDPVSARFMHQNFFEFLPQFKITIIGNNKPRLRNVDEANRRRFNLAPFIHKPANPDRQLEAKLQAEHPAILRWMIEGCLDWQRNGLVKPNVVIATTDEYFVEQDIVRQWIEASCDTKPAQIADASKNLFASWTAYARAMSEEAGTATAFGIKLQSLGYEQIRGTLGIRGRGYRGIKVNPSKENGSGSDLSA